MPSPLTDLALRLDGFRAKRATRDAILDRQEARLNDLLAFVLRNSRYYKHRYADVDRPITDLRSLPPVTKPELMANFDAVVTDTAVEWADVRAFTHDPETIGRRFLDRYPVWTTSGTTGEPGIFLQDDRAMLATDAAGDRWSLPVLFDPTVLVRLLRANWRTAELAIGGGHFAAAAGIAMFRREHPSLRDRLRLVSPDRPIADVVAELNAFQPAILVGYPSVLLELERRQRTGDLDISPAYVTPSGEPITDAQKRALASTFDCPVREIYGATEFYAIAVECGHGNLHLNSDWVVLEPVTEDYEPVPPGEPSDTVLLTNLANRVQPLVRYDLGDSVTISETACACGSAFPVIEVGGRQGAVLRFEAADGESVPVFPLALTSVLEGVAGVHRSQIVRTEDRTVSVRFDVDAGEDPDAVWSSIESSLTAFFDRQGLPDVVVERSAEPPAPDPNSGKYRHVWSAV